jgi:hypothetical protein
MEPEKPSRAGTAVNVLERLVLFVLSASVGLVNLLIGLAVAAHLGVLPKGASARILRVTGRATSALSRFMAKPAPPARPRKKRP